MTVFRVPSLSFALRCDKCATMRFETKATPTLTGLPLRTTLRSDPIEPRERPAGSHRPRRKNRGLLLIGLLSMPWRTTLA